MKNEKDKIGFEQLFEFFGVEFTSFTGDEGHAEECVFCGKAQFYANIETGLWKCHSENTCGLAGNAVEFVRAVYSGLLKETTAREYQRLKKLRKISTQTLKRHGWVWNGANDCWLIPFKSEAGEVLTLTRF